MTPKKIVAFLDRYAVGQAQAKQALALAAWRTWLGANHATRARITRARGAEGPQVVLLIGPTGCGKSYLLRKLAGLFGSNLLNFSATSLVQTGYVGTSIDSLLQEVFVRSGYCKETSERSIVLLDEIDKCASTGVSGGPDVSGVGVQQALLTVFDGRPATVTHPRGRETIDTSGMLFVCAGAFVGLDALVRQRTRRANTIGFGQGEGQQVSEGVAEIQTEDLVRFGMIPEFIGRFTTISHLGKLSAVDLTQVLLQGKDSVVERKRKMFSTLGVELKFEDAALTACAEEAERLGIGARGLTRVVNSILAEDEFHLPELAKKKVGLVVTEATVRKRARARQIKKAPGPVRQKKKGSKQPTLPLQAKAVQGQDPTKG